MKTMILILLTSALLGGSLGLRGLPGSTAGTDETDRAPSAATCTTSYPGDEAAPGSVAVWQAGFTAHRTRRHSDAEQMCLLGKVRLLSAHLDEAVPMSTAGDAARVLLPAQAATPERAFDAQLLALWLNVATGSVALADPADGDGDGTAETTVDGLLTAAETERGSTTPEPATLQGYTRALERLNLPG